MKKWLVVIPLLLLIGFNEASAQVRAFKSYDDVSHWFVLLFSQQVQAEYGLQLVLQFDEENDFALGSAQIQGPRYIINVGRRLSESTSPEIRPLAYAFMLCHELGHLAGGAPKKTLGAYWSSAEGQSDYFAGSCLKKLLSERVDDEESSAVHEEAILAGEQFFLAIHAVKSKLPKLIYNESAPDRGTPDLTKVRETNLGYPATLQCRLDSVVNGVRGGKQPACWFKN